MKSKYLNALFFLSLVSTSFAQVGIGTTAPDDSSLLEIKATNKGLLLPRVALTGSTDTATIVLPATSLLIYNTATAGTSPNTVTPGYYYYTGTQWERLTNNGADTIGAFTTATTNGATIAGGVLQLAPASVDYGGIVNTDAQTFSGTKTFTSDAFVNGLTVGRGNGNEPSNTALGAYALYSNSTGVFNSAFGSAALTYNTSGFFNSAFGSGALFSNTSGNFNSAFGNCALCLNTGNANVAIGDNAGLNNITGDSNTFLGYNAQPEFDNLSNAIAIGATAIVSADNTIQLGNFSVTDIYGGNPAGGSGTGAIFHGNSFVANSDARIKKDIVNSKYGLDAILKLRPVDYHLINDVKQEPQVGFIAQEVKAVVPELVIGKEGDLTKGEILGVNYAGLTPILTKAIQEQQKEIETLKAEPVLTKAIQDQQKEIETLKAEIASMKALFAKEISKK